MKEVCAKPGMAKGHGRPWLTSGWLPPSTWTVNTRRLHTAIDGVPPTGYEAAYYAQTQP